MRNLHKKVKNMREGGKIAVRILGEVLKKVEPGVTTNELNDLAEDLCRENKVKPAFKGYMGFPSALCVGPNEVVVHGIPSDEVMEEGDIISIDFGIQYKGVFLDFARTVGVGKISGNAQKLIDTAEKAWNKAFSKAVPGNRVGDISHEIQKNVEAEGFSVVREMVGHGVGFELHEDPMIPGYGDPGEGEPLYEGQTLAIEAIINEGKKEIKISRKDGWTTRTKDGMLSALFENTIVVSKKPEILTPL